MNSYDFNNLYDDAEDSATEATNDALKVMELRNNLLDITIANKEDELVRATNPGVKEAWDKYQMLLTLARKS